MGSCLLAPERSSFVVCPALCNSHSDTLARPASQGGGGGRGTRHGVCLLPIVGAGGTQAAPAAAAVALSAPPLAALRSSALPLPPPSQRACTQAPLRPSLAITRAQATPRSR